MLGVRRTHSVLAPFSFQRIGPRESIRFRDLNIRQWISIANPLSFQWPRQAKAKNSQLPFRLKPLK